MARRIRFRDIYFIENESDASIIETLLEERHIHCMVHGAAPIALFDARSGERRIAVEEEMYHAAREVIADAITRGIISKRGRFCD
ncbi:MAG TPA: hypothetical protein ENJ37_07715 [Deltaproteobacteria bacterium]|nr:hypothetical protein [Deltaproteobacteria bacterium]